MMQNQRYTCNPDFRYTQQANSQLNCGIGHQTTSRRIGMDFPQQYIMYVSRLIALISISSRLFGVPAWHGMSDRLPTPLAGAPTEEGINRTTHKLWRWRAVAHPRKTSPFPAEPTRAASKE